MGLVLRALDTLSIRLDATTTDQDHLRGSGAVDVDAIIRKAKKS